jgi:D-xylose transport system substrate-binding protein
MRAGVVALVVAGLIGAGCGGGGESGGREVAVLLPGPAGSTRWLEVDRPLLVRELRRRGLEPTVHQARDDPAVQRRQAARALDDGADLLILVPVDARAGGDVIAAAHRDEVPVLDYDRLTIGGGADFHVSFDGVQVGTLQARSLSVCLAEQGRSRPRVAMLHGDPADSNAALFRRGYEGVARPQFASGTWRLAGEAEIPRYDRDLAERAMARILRRNEVDGVLAANDTIASGAIAALRRAGIGGVPVTGQDATLEGLRHMVTGEMCMSVYKPIADEAAAAAEAADALVDGRRPTASNVVDDRREGVRAVLLEPSAVTERNLGSYVASTAPDLPGADAVCAGALAERCDERGLR